MENALKILIYLYYIYYFLEIRFVSYFMFAYKTCILTAHQREDIISKSKHSIQVRNVFYTDYFTYCI